MLKEIIQSKQLQFQSKIKMLLQNIAQEKKFIQEKNFDFYMSHAIKIEYVIEFERISLIIEFDN